jgi:hypothetical protein
MTALGAATARLARFRGWLAVRHSLWVEAVAVLGLYGLYEAARGIVAGETGEAERHARRLVDVERSLHVFVEANVQHAVRSLPGLIGLLDAAYLTLHLSVTAVVLLWLHRHRPTAFPFVRTTLLLASGLALVGYFAFPTAPPRLADVGIADTISNGHVNLNAGLLSSFYNPYAAVPSMHVCYALVIAAAVLRHGRGRFVRVLALVYPLAVLLTIVATGNHFFLDAAAGAVVAAAATVAAALLVRRPAPARLTAVPAVAPLAQRDELAA